MFLYVGTFTDCFMGGAPSEGLYVFHFDRRTLRATQVQIVTDVISPSFLCLHASTRTLYAAERQFSANDKSSGAISAWRIGASGTLSANWKIASGGASCAHIAVSKQGDRLAVANPLGPSVGLCTLDADGSPIGPVKAVYHSGTGPRERQEAPWPHSATFDHEAARILACDLGLDRVFLYEIDPASNVLMPSRQPFAQVSSGAGARHMAWSNDGRTAYVVNELDSTLSAFDYESTKGSLICKQTISTLPDGYSSPPNQPAEIAVAPDGRCLYVTNRGHESIAVFEIDLPSQRVRSLGHAPTFGQTPRHFTLSPDGAFGFISNQLSAEIIGYNVDAATGELSVIGAVCAVPSPSCVVIFDPSTQRP